MIGNGGPVRNRARRSSSSAEKARRMSTDTSPFDARPPAEVLRLEPGAEPTPGYRLERLLGRGGFGEVWKARGPGGVAVALKFIRLDGKAGGFELRSLEMMKDVRHGNLLSLFGVWQREPFIILALELADRSLMDRLQEAQAQGQPGIPLPELLEYLRDAARALDFLNEPRHALDGKAGLSIQHRDVKPHNLLLVGDTVKLADFGLARLLERRATSHTGAMTPAYAAPEFFKGRTTSQSDQYSLAVAYCQLRGGRLPFAGTPEQMMMGHSQEAPDLGMVPEAERPAVARALSKNPEDRWPNCRAFVQALAAAAHVPLPPGGDSTTPAPEPALLTALPAGPARRRLWPWLLAGAVLLPALLLGGGLAIWYALGRLEGWSGSVMMTKRVTAKSVDSEKPSPKGITGVAFTPDGRVVSVGEDGAVNWWGDSAQVAEFAVSLLRHPLHQIPNAKGMTLSPDGRRFLIDEANGVGLYDVWTGTKLRYVPFPKTIFDATYVIHCKAFSPDGRRFIVGYTRKAFDGGQQVLVGDLDAKTRMLGGPDHGVDMAEPVCVALSPDGKKALSAGTDGVRVWDVEKGAFLQKIERGGVISMAFSPDGKQVLLGEEFDTLLLVDADSGKELRSFAGHSGGVSCVTFSADGKQALSGGWDRIVRLWDVETGKQLELFRGHEAVVTGVGFSPDGTKAVSGSKDGAVRLWQLPGGAVKK
jgi:serine/threonine protein kinase